MKIKRLLTNICSDNLELSKVFYTSLFDFDVDFDSDWFIHLISKDKQLELGIIDRKNELIPAPYQEHPQGVYITFVVENVDTLFEYAQNNGIEILEEPGDTFYGQRRMILKDPNGVLVDVSSPMQHFEKE